MVNLVPHDQYQNSVKLQLGRLEALKSRVSKLLIARLAIYAIVTFGSLYFCWRITKSIWPSFMNPSSAGEALFQWVIFILLAAGCVCAGLVVPRWFVTDKMFPPRNLKCPHCALLIDVHSEFQCGFCSNKTSKQPPQQTKIATDPCVAKVRRNGKNEKCAHKATALMCPNCRNDVVLDLAAYNSAPQMDFGFEGTVTALLPGKE